MIRAILLAAAAAASVGTQAGEIRFVTCPVYRDTDSGRKSGCWLATDPDSGIRYDVSPAPTKPDWNHGILVEGRVSPEGSGPCGAVTLDPVRVSVLDTACTRFSIQAEGFKGRPAVLPPRNVRPLYADRKAAAKPWLERRFTIPFDFGSSFITYQLADYYLDQMIGYVLDTGAKRIVLSPGAQTAPSLVSGSSLAEPAGLARTRAEVVRRALVMRGVAPDRIEIASNRDGPYAPEAFDGLAGPSARRVDVRVIP